MTAYEAATTGATATVDPPYNAQRTAPQGVALTNTDTDGGGIARTTVESYPPAADPPAGQLDLAVPSIRVLSDAPTLDSIGRPVDWSPTGVVREEPGKLRVLIDNVDRTWVNGIRTTVDEWSSDDPFGDGPARFTFHGLSPFASTPAWLYKGARAIIRIFRAGSGKTLWAGHLVTDADSPEAPGSWIAVGGLYQAQMAVVQPTLDAVERDLGTIIATNLNGVVSRIYETTVAKTVGVTARSYGSPGQYVLDYVRELLAQSIREDGNRWTVLCDRRRPVLQVRDVATVSATWRAGQQGIELDLRDDLEDEPGVLFGYGVAPDGYAWMGWVYPDFVEDSSPPYPNNNPANTINLGDTDASTDSGDGVSTWQQRARELGYRITVDGVFSSADVQVLKYVQRDYGIQVDGSLGPQSWAATFGVGSNTGSLSNAYRRPLAWRSEVEPYLYDARGRRAGANPDYDHTAARVERDVNFGQGITRREATLIARRLLDFETGKGYAGTITAEVSGITGDHLIELRAGTNVELLGHRGEASRVLHVASITHRPEEGTATLTVDEKARDLDTVVGALERDRAARRDLAARKGQTYRSSAVVQDRVIPFDGDSGAGFIPRHAMFGGLWNVLRIPVSELGRVAKIEYRTLTPATKFCLALFGAPLTANDLVRYVGNPLGEAGTYKKFDENRGILEHRFGLIEAWGEFGEGAGYHANPNDETASHGYESRGADVTGWLVDNGGFEYRSQIAPWIWVAEWAPVACFSEGRIFPAPVV